MKHISQISRIFRAWANRASEYVEENKLSAYELKDCQQLFSTLQEDFPEYIESCQMT